MPEPSALQIERAMSAAMQLRDELLAGDPEAEADTKLLTDLYDGQTPVVEIIDRLAEVAIKDKLFVDAARARARRLELRNERVRGTIKQMLEGLSLRKLERPVYTATVADGQPKVSVTDASKLPTALLSPDKPLIAKTLKAGNRVEGAELTAPETTLRLLSR
jgi:hypothetical protein